MHLRSLELHGFKAFADRQRFEFGPGITVIVGPNGSGKSNVADAIRWALGEQSARQIRARRTEDVIFSGSERRRPLGAAEVTLTLDNAEGWMPVDYGEVAVARRADRSGENEYRVNGQRVRLGDVLDLFRRAQVGQNSYAMMSQGLVDEVLALRPRERRGLVEEAADLGRHRHQLALAERRLTGTRDNLGRARLLLREIEPRVRALERQSRRARRYRELAAELSDALSLYLQTELRSAQETLAATRAAHDQRREAFAQAASELASAGERARALGQQRGAREAALAEAEASERSLRERVRELEQERALARQRDELLAARAAELERDVRELGAAGEPGPPAEGGEPEAGELSGRRAAAAELAASERRALQASDDEARALLRELAEAEARRARHEAERDELRRLAARAAEERARAESARGSALERRRGLLERARDHGERVLRLTTRERTLGPSIEEARRRRAAAERSAEEEHLRLAQLTAELAASEAALAQAEERRRLIERLSEQAPGAGGGAGALLEAAARAREGGGEPSTELLRGIAGTIGQLIRVPGDLTEAIEAALSEQIGAIVVERDEAALAALDFLREQEAGYATVYALDRVRASPPLNLLNERGVIGVAARLVRVERPYRTLVDALLGRTIVVDDLDTARRILTRGLGSVVTRGGTLLRPNGAVFGGRGGGASEQLSLKRELDELPERLERARGGIESARARLSRQEDAVAGARSQVEAARRAVEGSEQERRELDAERESLARRFAPLAAALRADRSVLLPGPGEGEAAGGGGGLREAEERVEGSGRELEALRDRSQALVAERDRALERVTSAQASLARLEGELQALEARREERAARERRARELLHERREQLAASRREREDLALRLGDLDARLERARGQLEEAAAALAPSRSALSEVEAAEREVSEARAEVQARQLQAERGLLEAEAQLSRHEEAVAGWLAQIADEGMRVDEHGQVRSELAPAVAEPPRSEFDGAWREAAADGAGEEGGEEPQGAPGGGLPPLRGGAAVDAAELRERVSELRARIRSLGPVNVDALAELEEERQRVEFLSGQLRDLEETERELRGAIAELRRLIRRRFAETFERVNAAFGEYFRRFFGGGSAELRLERASAGSGDAAEDAPEGDAPDGADGGADGGGDGGAGDPDPGVEISAQPPGKRITSLAMLSGGERSMTSVALLFALLSVNPAPVCVLDEVDAALDEANVERFVETLRELTARSQFIVVTHNRRTIERADAIYGITMGEDSVSRVLSLSGGDLPAAG